MEDDMHHRLTVAVALSLLTAVSAAPSAHNPTPRVDVLVDNTPRPSYAARGTTYIEAIRSREYAIRLYNPYPVRVAVALSVDGLNTIDARHTTATAARKWVIEPYGTITISGWQTSMTDARRFEFTTEEQSYGQKLGKTDDLGVITAVFFRERVARVVPLTAVKSESPAQDDKRRNDAERPAPGASSASGGLGAPASQRAAEPTDYAATGIGRRTDHAVTQVHLDLESSPASTINIRYEYRSQLVRLGILPDRPAGEDPIDRRERARGFTPGFCPDIKQEGPLEERW
jgi:hypothetical protein